MTHKKGFPEQGPCQCHSHIQEGGMSAIHPLRKDELREMILVEEICVYRYQLDGVPEKWIPAGEQE